MKNLSEAIPALSIFLISFLGYFLDIPLIGLIPLIYWSIFRFDLVPISFIFLWGGIEDIIWGYPIGHNPFIYLSLMLLISWDRPLTMSLNFINLWKFFSMLIFLVWSLVGGIHFMLDIYPFTMHEIINHLCIFILGYPVWAQFILKIHRKYIT